MNEHSAPGANDYTTDVRTAGDESDGRIRTVGWCEAHSALAEDVRRVTVLEGTAPPVWGTHACGTCRERHGLAAAPRQSKAASTQ